MTATMPPPPPPPPPAPPTLDAKAAREQMQALKKQQREFRKERTVSRIKGVHPSVWAAAGIGLVLVGGAVGCQRVQSSQAEFQRDTALALASLREPVTATSQPQATVQGIDNPLEQWLDDTGTVKLTPQAVWTIGPTADGAGLLPGRSTYVMRQILEQADVCRLFIRLDDQNLPHITKEPGAGAVPLVECKPTTSSTTKPAAAVSPSSTTPTTVGG